MTESVAPVLIVASDRELRRVLEAEATARGLRSTCVDSTDAAVAVVDAEQVEVAVIDLSVGLENSVTVISRMKALVPDAEAVVMVGGEALCPTLRWYDFDAFAFVRKPLDIDLLFSTTQRAVERVRMATANRRLVWELQTINGIAQGMSRSLELRDVLTTALQHLAATFDAAGGSIRLRDAVTGAYEIAAFVGPHVMRQVWEECGRAFPRPSDEAIASRRTVLIDDLAKYVPERVDTLPIRSALSVPLFAGDDLVGTLTLGSRRPRRFQDADQQLLAIVAGQIVVAIENARLHDSVSRGKREWEETFDAISDPIAVFDHRGELLRGNTALAALLERDVRALRHVGCDVVGFCGGGCPACAVGRAVAQDGGRAEITRADGQIFSVTTFPIVDARGGASVVQVAKNVTEEIRSARRLRQMSEELSVTNARLMAALDQLKSTQAQLLQAEKLSAIGQLVAGVAHELNNPLTSVIGYAQLLEEELLDRDGAVELRPRPELAQDMRRIAQESERAARIVRNLLAFARRQTAARSPQDIADLCARVLALRAYEFRLNGVELRTEFDPQLPQVVVDGSQFQQAILNLILNAEQAMRKQTIRRLIVAARFDRDAGAVEVRITDSGHGIDDVNLTRIFDPFFTTRDVGEGTGLGLSICYGIVRDHGGHIRVESQVQVGTTFIITLPARLEDPGLAADDILVAVSDQSAREFIVAALSGWGHRATGVTTVDQALDRYRRGRIQAMVVDNALLEADLPAWRAMRDADGPTVPLILVGLSPTDCEAERFGREQASATLAPPFELRALRSALRAVSKECV